MKNSTSKIAFVAGISLALTFTFSCSGGDSEVAPNTEQSYNYCITANNTCLTGPFTASTCTGQLSNSCPNSSSSSAILSSSSSKPSSSSSSIAQSSSSIVPSIFTDKGNDIANYRTVKIGVQVWMAENLNYAIEGSKCYGEGGQVIDHDYVKATQKVITLSPAEIQANCDKYGRLYDWYTAMVLQPPSVNAPLTIPAQHRGICPSGWHLPSFHEFDYLYGVVFPMGATKLKATSGWNTAGGYDNGTDDYGFSALPGGYGYDKNSYDNSSYNNGGWEGWWWIANNTNKNNAYYWLISFDKQSIIFDMSTPVTDKSSLFSVRCIQDCANASKFGCIE